MVYDMPTGIQVFKKRPKMAKNRHKWPKTAQNGPKRPKTAQNTFSCLTLAQYKVAIVVGHARRICEVHFDILD